MSLTDAVQPVNTHYSPVTSQRSVSVSLTDAVQPVSTHYSPVTSQRSVSVSLTNAVQPVKLVLTIHLSPHRGVFL